MMITCMLQGTLCDTGIPCTFYGENICSVEPRRKGMISCQILCIRLNLVRFDFRQAVTSTQWEQVEGGKLLRNLHFVPEHYQSKDLPRPLFKLPILNLNIKSKE